MVCQPPAANQHDRQTPALLLRYKAGGPELLRDDENQCGQFAWRGSTILPPSQQEQAANAFAELEPYGVTLNEVVQDWLARRKISRGVDSVRGRDGCVSESDKRSESYTRSIRQTRNRLESLHGKMINTITPADLRTAMDGMPDSVKNFTIRILGGLFNFAIKARALCREPDQETRHEEARGRGG